MYRDIILVLLIIIAVIYDLRERRIPNLLIVSGLLMALIYHMHIGGTAALLYSLKGLATGIALLFIPFIMNGIGAGDVKLLGVIGALKGSTFALNSFLWMAMWGGILGLVIIISQKQLKNTIHRMSQGLLMLSLGGSFTEALSKDELSIYYPYAVAIGLGVLSSFVKGWC